MSKIMHKVFVSAAIDLRILKPDRGDLRGNPRDGADVRQRYRRGQKSSRSTSRRSVALTIVVWHLVDESEAT